MIAISTSDPAGCDLDEHHNQSHHLMSLRTYVYCFIRSYFVYQVLIGNVSRADWDRLEYYSRKVKSFNFRDTTGGHRDHWQVHPLTYFRIAQLQSSALFPSLCHLRFNLRNSATPHSIFLFVSPLLYSVELLNIPTEYEDDIVRRFLATLSESSQMLSRIVLRSGRMATDILKKFYYPLQAAPISRAFTSSFDD